MYFLFRICIFFNIYTILCIGDIMNLVPVVVENDMSVERSYDIFSRLLKDRIIFLSGEIIS